ncbi:MAG: penicillin-binding protein 2 [Patescibacteria group bacterium]
MVKHSLSHRKSLVSPNRIHVFVFVGFLATLVVGYRLFRLTYIDHVVYAQSAQRQQVAPSARLLGRGSVFVFDLSGGEKKLVATNSVTELDTERLYPKGTFAAHVLGFVGYNEHDRVGQYGVEGFYDSVLRASASNQKNIGSDVVLTIDPNIQAYSEATLQALLKKWSSPRGSIIVQEPTTGAILAMTSSPSFDPNQYGQFAFDDYVNPIVQEQFEPGSSFKPVTMAAALDSGSITPTTTYDDTGAVTIGTYTIKNFNEKTNGLQTMRQVLEKSLNTGTIFAQRRTGNDAFLNYIVAFGFGQKTGVDLAGEVPGTISNLYQGRAINFATASFGQGIAVTPLQLVSAYSAIANGGRLMKPYVVREIVHADGSSTMTKPSILGAPISEKTSTQLRSMLVDVVEKGFDKARIKGYDVAGKTGTAQIPNREGGYLEDEQFIHNFVGFAPAYAPRFVILIKMDKPKGITFASDSLSPVFGDLASFILRYLKVPPTRQ